ncbi:MAG TPA: flagellar hook-length control protein FliK [Bdellovibrionota bacterium]|nr:flagellar hook-length control protein FliK [Bdellovibrionota bacterium]
MSPTLLSSLQAADVRAQAPKRDPRDEAADAGGSSFAQIMAAAPAVQPIQPQVQPQAQPQAQVQAAPQAAVDAAKTVAQANPMAGEAKAAMAAAQASGIAGRMDFMGVTPWNPQWIRGGRPEPTDAASDTAQAQAAQTALLSQMQPAVGRMQIQETAQAQQFSSAASVTTRQVAPTQEPAEAPRPLSVDEIVQAARAHAQAMGFSPAQTQAPDLDSMAAAPQAARIQAPTAAHLSEDQVAMSQALAALRGSEVLSGQGPAHAVEGDSDDADAAPARALPMAAQPLSGQDFLAAREALKAPQQVAATVVPNQAQNVASTPAQPQSGDRQGAQGIGRAASRPDFAEKNAPVQSPAQSRELKGGPVPVATEKTFKKPLALDPSTVAPMALDSTPGAQFAPASPRPEMTGQVVPGSQAQDRLASTSVSGLANGIGSLRGQGGGEIRMKLQPEHLGELNLKVTTRGNEVAIEVRASSEKAREILEQSLPALKESLAGQRLVVGKIDIVSAGAMTDSAVNAPTTQHSSIDLGLGQQWRGPNSGQDGNWNGDGGRRAPRDDGGADLGSGMARAARPAGGGARSYGAAGAAGRINVLA